LGTGVGFDMGANKTPGEMTIQLVGGPTAVVEIGGVRLLTDSTFDPPGDHVIGTRNLVKTSGPSVPIYQLGDLDAVLSHDQHPDTSTTRPEKCSSACRRCLAPRRRRNASAVSCVTFRSGAAKSWRARTAANAGPIDVAVLFAGRARSPLMEAYLTLSADQAAEAAEILGSPVVIVMHVDGWQHLTEDAALVPEAFTRRGLADRLVVLTPEIVTAVSS
jgi:L-ascorbate metabolism protein UlaG (beta-lactamase superfamily)